ncbi:MAG: hypothetical protein ACI4KA_10865 [Oscillospiraceae bacterium]
MADKKVIDEYISLGTIQTSYLEKEFGKLQTNETIVTLERLEHIKERHIVDYPLFNDFAPQALSDPRPYHKGLEQYRHGVYGKTVV